MIFNRRSVVAAALALGACATASAPADPILGLWRHQSGSTYEFFPDGRVTFLDANVIPAPPPGLQAWSLVWRRTQDGYEIADALAPNQALSAARITGGQVEVRYPGRDPVTLMR